MLGILFKRNADEPVQPRILSEAEQWRETDYKYYPCFLPDEWVALELDTCAHQSIGWNYAMHRKPYIDALLRAVHSRVERDGVEHHPAFAPLVKALAAARHGNGEHDHIDRLGAIRKTFERPNHWSTLMNYPGVAL